MHLFHNNHTHLPDRILTLNTVKKNRKVSLLSQCARHWFSFLVFFDDLAESRASPSGPSPWVAAAVAAIKSPLISVANWKFGHVPRSDFTGAAAIAANVCQPQGGGGMCLSHMGGGQMCLSHMGGANVCQPHGGGGGGWGEIGKGKCCVIGSSHVRGSQYFPIFIILHSNRIGRGLRGPIWELFAHWWKHLWSIKYLF